MGNLSKFLGNDFDARNEETRGFDPVPAGIYEVEIENVDMKDLKSGKGEGVQFTYVVTGPTHVGRKLFENLNMRHENQTAEKIARQTYAEIAKAVNRPKCLESDELIGCRLRVKVKVRKQDGFDDRNEISGHEALDGPVTAGAAKAAASAPSKKPWERKAA